MTTSRMRCDAAAAASEHFINLKQRQENALVEAQEEEIYLTLKGVLLHLSRDRGVCHSPRKHYLPEKIVFELFSDYRFTISISSN